MKKINPYDFVRVEWNKPSRRAPALPGDRFAGLSGRLEGSITTLTPLFIPDKRTANPQRFIQNGQREAIIPGSSLKGLFRSLVETIDGGAFWFCQEDGVPGAFRQPRTTNELDAACRMFGYLSSKEVLAGRVSFEDARCPRPTRHSPIYTCVLSNPKPRHHVWYFDAQNRVAGRKFYRHSTELQTASKIIGNNQNAYIEPVGKDSVFTFAAHFHTLTVEDFGLLLYALLLDPDPPDADGPRMRHKLGYAKPAGLGSVHGQLNWIELVDYAARYRSGGGITRYERNGPQGDTLTPFVEPYIQPFVADRTSPTLQDLRRIWQWPPTHQASYPTQDWFKANGRLPISATERD